jgi:hypothetical protein
MQTRRTILNPSRSTVAPRSVRVFVAACAAASFFALVAIGCGEIVERVPARPRQDRPNTANFALEVDPIMRGTVASETAVVGLNPVVVRGYGLVVGLQDTGGRLMPAEVRASMMQELSRRGIGNPTTSPEGWSPSTLLDSPNTAVVVVEGVIPPGATRGTKFDLRVSALPGSDVNSLEGGRLYTTDLRPGPLLVGSRQAKIIASAKGNIFINPFVEPGATRSDAVNRLVGRILDGGETTDDIPLKLKLATSSSTRARTIQSALNSVFPREKRQSALTARGENADSIALTVPPSYKGRSEEFIQLAMHVPLDITASETTALAVRRALLANPGTAESAMWRFRAIGRRALPVIQDLYTYPEEDPRMAALRAGAALDDPLAVKPLLDMAARGSTDNRLGAIQLLGDMGFNPDIDVGLRPLLADIDVDVRLATYESLLKRGDPLITRFNVDGKFDLALVPSNQPLVYVAQSGRPTIAIFDDRLAVDRPLTLALWSNRDPADERAPRGVHPVPRAHHDRGEAVPGPRALLRRDDRRRPSDLARGLPEERLQGRAGPHSRRDPPQPARGREGDPPRVRCGARGRRSRVPRRSGGRIQRPRLRAAAC